MAIQISMLAQSQADRTGYTRTSALPLSTQADGSLAGVTLRPPVFTRYDPNRADPFAIIKANMPAQPTAMAAPSTLPTSLIVIGVIIVALVIYRMARKAG